jgi:hypothetical protein
MPKLSKVELSITPQHFIALWLAIHGGDPAPDRVGVLVAGTAVLQQLDEIKAQEAGALRTQVVAVMQKALSSFE